LCPGSELESESELAVCVVPRPGAALKPEDLAHFVNDNAPYYFVPRYIELAAELPRNAQCKTGFEVTR
jgi:crotonobetaine/carnitine-CoA ligase